MAARRCSFLVCSILLLLEGALATQTVDAAMKYAEAERASEVAAMKHAEAEKASEVEDSSANARPAGLAATAGSGRHRVNLHRQRVPVKNANAGTVSYKSVYFGSIYLGAPEKQEFSVVFDTGSGHTVVPSMDCESNTCQIHRRYERSLSYLARDVDYDGTTVGEGQPRDQITVAFGTGEITGEFVHDRICLEGPASPPKHHNETEAEGGEDEESEEVEKDEEEEFPGHSCFEMRMVMATEMTEQPFKSFSFDGILGLGLDGLALAPEFSYVNQMLAQGIMAEPVFGVFLGDSDEEQSEISFGGVSEERVKSDILWSPVAMPELGYWQVRILTLRVGNKVLDYCSDGECRAVVDTGTSLLAVPKEFAPELQQELAAVSSPPPEAPSPGKAPDATCRHAIGPDLQFELSNGLIVTLRPGEYARQSTVIKTNTTDSTNATTAAEGAKDDAAPAAPVICKPTLMPIDLPAPLGPKLFIWGEPVLKKYYTVYDWKEKRIGFASARHAGQEDVPNDLSVKKVGDDDDDDWLSKVVKPLLR